ncbi:MAG: OsmC family protein [Candidatus Hydrothermia bacterium]
MKIRLSHESGMRFVAQGPSGRTFSFDASPDQGGTGPTPMETLLACAGACTGMDMVSLLGKMGVRFSDFWIELDGERAGEHPRVYKAIRLEYHFVGQESDREKYERAASLSMEKYCSVSAHLKAIARIDWVVVIHES